MHLLLLLCLLASLFAPAPGVMEDRSPPIRVGMKFQHWNYLLEIYGVDSDGDYLFQGYEFKNRDWIGGNTISRKELEALLKDCPQRGVKRAVREVDVRRRVRGDR